MEWVDALDRKLLPKAVLSSKKGPSLVGDVVERDGPVEDNDPEEEEQECVGDQDPLSELSPFGRIYVVLDQLTTLNTLHYLRTSPGEEASLDGAGGSDRDGLSEVKQALLQSVQCLEQLLGVETMRDRLSIFVKELVKTFDPVVSVGSLSKTAWDVVALVFLTKAEWCISQIQDADLLLLESRTADACGLTHETFAALGGVLDERRFE